MKKESLLVSLLLATVVDAARETKQNSTDAICVFQVGNASGYVSFHQDLDGKNVTVHGNITNLPQGKHGFHVHEYGDLSKGCSSTGSHYNPNKRNHGAPDVEDRHVGDLGNIEADECGVAVFNLTDHLLTLNGEHSIIGRAVVVHAGEDDLGRGGHNDSLTTGHAGGRLTCCVIGIRQKSNK
ncbi:superoxide dismutase [Cu-Zn]-like [Dermacentor silvarum]|uniref:superoxide dismutase [Cu-Zn]-like n=1 Tax=Dermacentor silvarum TaxID=543639 RepID=UPI001899EC97|nr:superoxide dismutase [Cu-Zn]-like [Dermacentor silvarum]XP_049516334.1 superoxide dismutase [Cu-Zn]-like [Dermacentor silvarum]